MSRPVRRLVTALLAFAAIAAADSSFNVQTAQAHCTLGCENFCHSTEYGIALCTSACGPRTWVVCNEDTCAPGWQDNACVPVGGT